MNQLTALYATIQSVNMDSKYMPDMKQHQMLWAPRGEIVTQMHLYRILKNQLP